ncbi:hypothetical protein FPV67DRAFT_1458380 [Lyophyllum atratum]|nr:hypothetical protein FPV67DRAFT_1458380 [Lyophyllum atratum]
MTMTMTVKEEHQYTNRRSSPIKAYPPSPILFQPMSCPFSFRSASDLDPEDDRSVSHPSTPTRRRDAILEVWASSVSSPLFVMRGPTPYVIAMSKKNRRLPRWQSVLEHEGFDLPIINTITTSCICDFSPYIRRVGTSLDVANYEVVFWLHELGVPVWYQLKDDHARHPLLKAFAPPPYTPSIATHDSVMLPRFSTLARDLSTSYKILTKAERLAVVNFRFKMHDKANEQKVQRETADDRQRRLNRMRQPPTMSASVFVWEEDSEDSTKFVRCAVPKQEREETLGWFSCSQKRYGMFWNEWDCCVDLGDNDEGDDDEYSDDEPFDLSDTLLDEVPIEHPRCLSPSEIPGKQTDGKSFGHFNEVKYSSNNFALMCNSWQEDFLETLPTYYAYIPPLPYPMYLAPIMNQADAKLVFKFFGELLTHTLSFYKHQLVAPLAQQYMQQLMKLRHLQKVFTGPRQNKAWYMFDLNNAATTNWHLAVQNVRDALVICRLPNIWSESEIAQYLLRHEVRFHTLQSDKTILRAKKQLFSPCVFLTRPKKYSFSDRDYDAYVLQCSAMFSQPSAQAALIRVLDGPSGWSELQMMFTATDINTGEVFLDDELTMIELDLICGAYIDMNNTRRPG